MEKTSFFAYCRLIRKDMSKTAEAFSVSILSFLKGNDFMAAIDFCRFYQKELNYKKTGFFEAPCTPKEKNLNESIQLKFILRIIERE